MAEGQIGSITKLLQAFEEHNLKKAEESKGLHEKIDIIRKFKDREPPFTDDERKTILSLTCYNHLGYCCGLQKGCPFRDAALGIFKITAREYGNAKNNCQMQLLKGR
jgi:predicted metal-binding transcription factor (methanogenesis marker protein 9)